MARYHREWASAWKLAMWVFIVVAVVGTLAHGISAALFFGVFVIVSDRFKDMHTDQSVQWRLIEDLIQV